MNDEADSQPVVSFGPFENVPVDEIKLAGFFCQDCYHAVRFLAVKLPRLPSRMMFYECGCGKSVLAWEHESQARGPERWRRLMERGKPRGVVLFTINEGKIVTEF